MEEQTEKLFAVIVAAGEGKRVGGPVPKQFLSLQGRPLLDWSIAAFEKCEEVAGIVVAVAEEYFEEVQARYMRNPKFSKVRGVAVGGAVRQESVASALKLLPSETAWVAIHDAARPFVTPQLIRATFTLASGRHFEATVATIDRARLP